MLLDATNDARTAAKRTEKASFQQSCRDLKRHKIDPRGPGAGLGLHLEPRGHLLEESFEASQLHRTPFQTVKTYHFTCTYYIYIILYYIIPHDIISYHLISYVRSTSHMALSRRLTLSGSRQKRTRCPQAMRTLSMRRTEANRSSTAPVSTPSLRLRAHDPRSSCILSYIPLISSLYIHTYIYTYILCIYLISLISRHAMSSNSRLYYSSHY